MKRISCLAILVAGLLPLAPVWGQDAATEERLNKLSGQVEDLITAQKNLQTEISRLSDRLDSLREQVNKPNSAYLTSDDLKPLLDGIKEVDHKRIADAEKIQAQLKEIQRLAEKAPAPPKRSAEKPAAPERPEKGYEYEVQSGDTLSTIVAAYREKNVKVTMDQVLKANPGLKPERMRVGQKIFIPSP